MALGNNVRIERVHAQPSSATFTIPPIRRLLSDEVGPGLWCDPFAGWNSPATVTNDLNPAAPTQAHEEALRFLRSQLPGIYAGVFYDPPYSFRQAKEVYEGLGAEKPERFSGTEYWAACRDEIMRITVPGGKVLCFGWTSTGLGMSRGFDMIRVLLVAHGGARNDTICTVETKTGTPSPKMLRSITRRCDVKA